MRTPEGPWAIVHTIGPFYGELHPDYHRLDLRASRNIHVLYDRENIRGLAIDEKTFTERPDGRIMASFDEEAWFGIMPSFGISWEF